MVELEVELFKVFWLLLRCSADDCVCGVDGAEEDDGELVAWSSAKMVAISFCMKAQGTLEPRSGHFSPDGQYTSPGPGPPAEVCCCCCLLIAVREQGKQNL